MRVCELRLTSRSVPGRGYKLPARGCEFPRAFTGTSTTIPRNNHRQTRNPASSMRLRTAWSEKGAGSKRFGAPQKRIGARWRRIATATWHQGQLVPAISSIFGQSHEGLSTLRAVKTMSNPGAVRAALTMPERRHHKPYVPRADGEFRDWLWNFARVIHHDPQAFLLTPADCAMLVELAGRFEAAYLERKRTRTAGTTVAKNDVRKNAWSIVRPMAMLIKHNPRIDDERKIELGVYLQRESGDQSRIAAPIDPPLLMNITGMRRRGGIGGVHRLRYQDGARPTSRRKPPEASGLELLVVIEDRRPGRGSPHSIAPMELPPGNQRLGWRGRNRRVAQPAEPLVKGRKTRLQIATRHVFNVRFDPQDTGKTALYHGRWVTERGLCGPWSRPALAMTIV